MKKILVGFLLFSTVLSAANPIDKKTCSMNGIKLAGKVKVVKNFADFKVKVVSSFPDIEVKKVSSFPDDCGEWQFVDSFPDFTIEYVTSFPDFTIRMVDHFPGVK
ncbi:hypothetical protein [Sebaldella sp. S0638]|uniref:hypothetical protein n=1 Tax=Sebaldella sp. S0638 TaxID=2957809 RepID=UPI0020A162B0|nr:hypothetical protein [Sebaldella sp. S0638]MCP1225289.1 hypothetical protein [Sebaldella sp. S0638]